MNTLTINSKVAYSFSYRQKIPELVSPLVAAEGLESFSDVVTVGEFVICAMKVEG